MGQRRKEVTRRRFLESAGVGAAAIGATVLANTGAASAKALLHAKGSLDFPTGELAVRVTDDDRRWSDGPPVEWTESHESAGEDAITLGPEKTFQEILGFGAAFTDGSCYLFSQLTPGALEELFRVLFAPTEMGLNVCRTCIGSSDASTSVYSFDDGEADPELKRFSIAHDRAYILPMLRQVRAVNPELFLFGSPWSPPGWMKDNGSMLGGCMRHTYMPSYAKYFVKFLRAYEEEGVPVQAVTVQNEVDAEQQSTMPACFWPQDCEADFVKEHLGPEFERNGVKTKIWIIDHNYNLWGRAIAELETPGVRKYTNAIAWHGYSGSVEWINRVRDVFPDTEMHWTEGSPDCNDPEYLKCWVPWAQKFTDILQNHCRSITGWCFVTDEHGHPNVGPYPLGGMVTIDSKSKMIYHSGQFWAMAHFSRHIKRGAVRVDSQSAAKDLSHCAFKNPDGSLVVVVTNAGGRRTCELRLQNRVARLELSANSVVTLTHSGWHSA